MSSQLVNLATEIITPADDDWLYVQLNAGGAGSDRKLKYNNITPLGKTLASANIWIGSGLNKATGRAITGVITLSNLGVTGFDASAFGITGTTACVGNDTRLSDPRTPVNTALTSGRIWVGSAGNVAAAVAVSGVVLVSNAGVTTFDASAFGSSGSTACVGNDSRLSDARTPVGTALLSAKIWVGSAGNVAAAVAVSGVITLSNAGVTAYAAGSITEAAFNFTNNVTANASTSAHGLLPLLDNNVTHFLNGQGGWTTPGGTGAPGGASGNVQYNDGAGGFGGSTAIILNGTQVGFFGVALVSQQAANSSMTDSTGGADGSSFNGVSGTGDDTTINNNFKRVRERLEEIRTLLFNYGLGT